MSIKRPAIKRKLAEQEKKSEKLTGKEKAGLVLWGIASVPLGIVGFVLFLLPWAIVALIWWFCVMALKSC